MEPSLIQSLLDWVAQHHTWAGIIVFFVAMGESLAIVGVMVPGVAVMLGVGALIGIGVLDFWPIFSWAVVGAIVGDGFSFWLGYHFKDQLRRIWPFSRHPRLLHQGEAFFRKHGGKSVFLGRFFGPVRAIIPTTAGMMQMSPWRFNVVNVSSALLWAPVYLGVGMVIGASLSLAAEVATRLALLLGALILTLWAGIWLVRRLYRLLAPKATQLSERLMQWGRNHPHLGQLSAALVDPQQGEFKGVALLGLILVGLAWAIIALFSHLTITPPLARLDSSTYHLLQGLRTPWGDQVMITLTQLGDGTMHIALLLGLGAWLLWRRHYFAVLHWLAAVGFGAVAAWLLKSSLKIPRPNPMFDGPMGYGFPSAHTVLAVCSFGFLAVLISREVAPRWRWLVYAVAWIFILLIAISRLYLGAHWLSDVLGGLLIGLIWISILGVAYRRHHAAVIDLKGLIGVPLAVLSLFGAWHVYDSREANLERYARHYETRQMGADEWARHGWRQLPPMRIDTRGVEMQPLNLQWAGSLETLRAILQQQGWRQPTPLSLDTALMWLKPDADPAELPLLPQVHDGRHPALQMISLQDHLLLRLWPADVVLGEQRIPLWLGYVGQLETATLPLLTVPRIGNDFDAPVAELLPQLTGLHREMRLRPGPWSSARNHWQGQVLLIWPMGQAHPQGESAP